MGGINNIMCGIAFIVNYNEKLDIPIDVIEQVFKNISKRGTDASGYYFERIDDGKKITRLIKGPYTTSVLWKIVHTQNKDKEKEKFYSNFRINGKEKLILLHARAMTHGSEYNNQNNMPIRSQDYVLIHNGVISNQRDATYHYRGEVDSEEILAKIAKEGLEKGVASVCGSMSIVLKPVASPNIFLYRNTNPLEIVYFMKEKLLIGASDAEYIPISEIQSAFSQNLFTPLITITSPIPHYLYSIDIEKPKVKCVAKISNIATGEFHAFN